MKRPVSQLFLIGLTFLLTANLQAADAYQAPTINQGDDEGYLTQAADLSVLFLPPDLKVVAFRNMDRLAPMRRIEAGSEVLELPVNLQQLGDTRITHEGHSLTLDDYFEQHNTAGLLIVQDGEILYERYGLGNDAETRWVSFSVAKSVVAMLIGAAIQEGYIESVDDKVTRYLPELASSPYADVSIKNLLQMASGVEWNEDYADPESDVATASYATLELYAFLNDKKRVAKPGERFNYNTAETNLAGTLLRSAIGNNLSTYLTEKVWQPFGMESDAFWQLTEPGGGEFGGCCINATLRDYARIGLFALANGKLADGTQVLPADWMAESTAPSRGYDGYGYFWWLGNPGSYEASGIFGQGIHVVPEKNLVIAVHSAWEHAGRNSDFDLLSAVYEAVADKL